MMKSIGTNADAITVLLVEDSPGDVRLTQEAFKDAKVHISLHVAWDGTEAMAFLKREGEPRQCASPGSDSAGSEPAQERWPGGSGGNQGKSDTKEHSCRDLDDFRVGGGYPPELFPSRELLHHQACGSGRILERRAKHRQFLVFRSQVAKRRALMKEKALEVLLVEDNAGDQQTEGLTGYTRDRLPG